MTPDLIDKLDELAGKAKDGTVGPAAFLYALRDAWPALRDRLRAAEAALEHASHCVPNMVCEGDYKMEQRFNQLYAAWRRTLEGASDE